EERLGIRILAREDERVGAVHPPADLLDEGRELRELRRDPGQLTRLERVHVRVGLVTPRVGIGVAGAADAGVVGGRVARRRFLLEVELAEARRDGSYELRLGGLRDRARAGIREIALDARVDTALLALDRRLGEAGSKLGDLLANVRALLLARATGREHQAVRYPDAQGERHGNRPSRPCEVQTRSMHRKPPFPLDASPE